MTKIEQGTFFTECLTVILLLLFTSGNLAAQLSNIHYLPPLYSRGMLNSHSLYVTTPSAATVNVTVKDGQNNTISTATVDNSGSVEIDLGNGYDAFGVIDESQLNITIPDTEGLIVEADQPISVQVRHNDTFHGLMLTSLGEIAMGTRFRAGTAYSTGDFDERADFISVMAIEDGTSIDFADFTPGLEFAGAGVLSPFSIVLDEGDSYVLATHPNNLNNLFLNGTLITANKNIVVNVGSWGNGSNGFIGRDISATQCIPADKTGTEHVLMSVDGDPDIERIIIVADINNTNIYLNNDPTPIANIFAGEYFILPSNVYSNDNNLYLQTSKPAFLYQTTGKEDYNGGLNAIPPIDCWGSKQVTIPKSDDDFSATASKVNILAPNGITVFQNGTALTNPLTIPGNTDWVTYQTNFTNTGDMYLSSSEYFQVGATLRSSFRGAAAYYAEYIQLDTLLDLVLCEGESVLVGENTYSETGNYTEHLISEKGCDSIVNLQLFISTEQEQFLQENICEDEFFEVGTNQYGTSGSYVDTLLNIYGCDSIINLELVVYPIYSDTFSLSICEGELFNDVIYTSDTTIVQNLLADNACDSTIVTHLQVFESYSFYQYLFLCEGESLTIGNSVYTTTGIYTDILTTINGCDSAIVTQLTVTPSYDQVFNTSLCQGDLYDGIPYFSDTTLIENFITNLGCDSIVTTNLNVDSVKYNILSTMLCPGQMVNGIQYFTPQLVVDTLQSSNGCDSIVNNNIMIQSFSSLDSVYINIGDPYNGEVFLQDTLLFDSLLTIDGCDSIHYTQVLINNIITNIINADLCEGGSFEGINYLNDTLFTEVYTAASGVDSIVNYFITVFPNYLDTVQITICTGDSIFLADAWQNTAGSYIDIFSSINTCDSVVITTLAVGNTIVNNIDITLCDGESHEGISYENDTTLFEVYSIDSVCDSLVYTNISLGESNSSLDTIYLIDGGEFEGEIYNTSTLVTFNQTNYIGCDSLEQVQLIVLNSFSQIDSIYLCYADIYDNISYYSDALLTDTLSLLGDSIYYTLIFVEPLRFSNEAFSICAGDSLFLEGSWQYTSGLYQDTYPLPGGCDSIHFTNLIVAQEISTHIDTLVCDSILINDFNYTQDTMVTDTLMSFFGCDSILFIDLTVSQSYASLDTVTINEGDIYDGNVYTESTLLSEEFLTLQNCDSILQVQVIVRPNIYNYFDLSLCQGEELLGLSLNSDTTLTDTLMAISGADSILIYTIAVTPYTYGQQDIGICLGDSIFLEGNYQYNAGVYFDTLSISNLCDSIVTTNLQVASEFQVPAQAIICPGDSYSFGGNDYTSTGTYRDTLLAAGGCDSIVVLSLTVLSDSYEVVNLEICEGQILVLPLGDDIITTSTTVFDTLVAYNGCDSIIQTNVIVTPQYFANIQGDGVFCEDGTTFLQAGDHIGYQWSTGAVTQEIEVEEPGTYYVTVTNEDGCISRDSIVVEDPVQLDLAYEIGQPICFGEPEGFIHIDTATGGEAPYNYALNGGEFVPYLDWDFLEGGAYDLAVQDANGCMHEETIYIPDPEQVQVNLGADIYLTVGDSVRLLAATSGENLVINWSPADFLSCDSCFTTVATPLDNRRYFATITDTLIGCSATDDINIIVNKTPAIYIPNSFSPNNDGENDFLTIYAKNATVDIQVFRIFNRWGGVVFERYNFEPNNEVLGWDGRQNGRVVNPGVFVYYVEIMLASGEIKVVQGDLTMLY